MTEENPSETRPDFLRSKPDEKAPTASPFTVVGLGASAGGLDALIQFLRALPPDTGMAFVIIQHLSPTHPSSLAEILSRSTAMHVSEVSESSESASVQPNCIYVIPPARDLVIADRKLHLIPQDRTPVHGGIDLFFRSLAHECGHQAIGIILSGFASDGTMGLKEIKAAGGITFAQDESALHGSMPNSAVASGIVDLVLSPEEIAHEIARIALHPYVATEKEDATGPAYPEESGQPSDLCYVQITQILLQATGVDFTHYKVNTLHRRIRRRMLLHRLETVSDYEKYLEETPAEAEALFQDILIHVTSFFRDAESFDGLAANIFPKLLADRSSKDPVRIWTLGCSTGEEAYSLAIAYTEYAEGIRSDVSFQILATDINDTMVGRARSGLYPKSIALVVSPERLQHFFVEEETGYRICKKIRERCVFSRHNALEDPPFSRVDFISCRNLLIYMQPVLQQRIMPLLHYALKPGGFLWLGSSETAGAARTLFDLEDGPNKIYVRKPGGNILGMHFRPRVSDAVGEVFSPTGTRLRAIPRADLQKEAERILLSKYAPPGVVITSGMDILQFQGETGAYLTPAAGSASLNLMKMLREGLLQGVRGAIQRAADSGRAVQEPGLRVKSEDGIREVTVNVIPIKTGVGRDNGFLVVFDGDGADTKPPENVKPPQMPEDDVSRLTLELAATREYLQTVIDQQESINAELQSANEEAQSTNEEMQSINEELETTKEEIQSSNEELVTVNEELNHRNNELNRLNESLSLARDFAESIVESVRSPLVVLDAQLRVKKASAAFYEAFLVTPVKTENRLIYDLGNGQWNIPAIRKLLEELLITEERIHDFEVQHTFEHIGLRIMLLNAHRLPVLPGQDNYIVLAIEDITERRALVNSLLDQATDLTKANRNKDQFLAMLAHELRNPVAALRNVAEILGSSDTLAVEVQGILDRQLENLSKMVNELLDVSRITEGKIELHPEVVALEDIFGAAISLTRSAMETRGHKLAVQLPVDPVYLNADSTRLDQVLGNLLTNACKYSEDGGQILLIAERDFSKGEDLPEVIIRVRDNGIGISAEMLPHIFDVFVQAENTLDRAHGGLGLGLTLVQKLITLHNGSVQAHSAGLGHGSEFVIRLPILPLTTKASSTASAPVREADVPRRILIVDDNSDYANSMSLLQRRRGHQILTASTGLEALAVAADFAPEVVLLDIGLPGMDGYEVARRLRLIPALTHVFMVALTGYGAQEDRGRAKAAGFDEYMVKPVNFHVLRGWLKTLPLEQGL